MAANIGGDCHCAEELCRYIGQTITIFTGSGGLSGSGFTGVLIGADCHCIRLLTDFGWPPACPIGSACTGDFGMGGFSKNNAAPRCEEGYYRDNPFGAICVIPTDQVVCYTLPVY